MVQKSEQLFNTDFGHGFSRIKHGFVNFVLLFQYPKFYVSKYLFHLYHLLTKSPLELGNLLTIVVVFHKLQV